MSCTSLKCLCQRILDITVVSSAARRADIQLWLRHRLLVRWRHDDVRHAAMNADLTDCSTSHSRKAASFSIFRFASMAGAFTLAFWSIVRMNVKTLLQFSRLTLKKHLAFLSEAGGVPPLR